MTWRVLSAPVSISFATQIAQHPSGKSSKVKWIYVFFPGHICSRIASLLEQDTSAPAASAEHIRTFRVSSMLQSYLIPSKLAYLSFQLVLEEASRSLRTSKLVCVKLHEAFLWSGGCHHCYKISSTGHRPPADWKMGQKCTSQWESVICKRDCVVQYGTIQDLPTWSRCSVLACCHAVSRLRRPGLPPHLHAMWGSKSCSASNLGLCNTHMA